MAAENSTPRARIFRKLLENRGAMLGAGVMCCLLLMSVLAYVVMPYDPFETDPRSALQPPTARHWLGTDNLGRDVLSRLILGSRWSLRVGLIAVAVSALIGVPLGLIAGYAGKGIDSVISRGVEVLMAIPSILLALGIVAILGPGAGNIMIAVGVTGIPRYVRVVRASVLSARENTYVEAARAAGGSESRIMISHILPNVLSPVIVMSTIQVAGAILSASSLGFLGLGAQPPIPEWGEMLSSARSFMRTAWWLTLFPGMAIMLSVLSMNLLGDGLRDALDPRLVQAGSQDTGQ
jgi:peptide/nickel transport system permease protein